MMNVDICSELTGTELKKCRKRQAIFAEADDCANAFLRAGCDKKSRFILCFIINLIFDVFYILIFIQLYLNPGSVLYVPGYVWFAYFSIGYFVIDIFAFFIILGSKRFKYLNWIGVFMQYGGRTIIGIFMTVMAALTIPPYILGPLIVLFFVDFFNATIAGGVITEAQGKPLMNLINKFKRDDQNGI